jgi:membrane protein implicated in regulation of membrane protease activity
MILVVALIFFWVSMDAKSDSFFESFVCPFLFTVFSILLWLRLMNKRKSSQSSFIGGDNFNGE